jgi:hypothetical protein
MKQPRPRDFQFCSEKSVNFQWIGRTPGARRAPRCRSCPQAAAPEARTIASWRGNCIVACDEGRPPGRGGRVAIAAGIGSRMSKPIGYGRGRDGL